MNQIQEEAKRLNYTDIRFSQSMELLRNNEFDSINQVSTDEILTLIWNNVYYHYDDSGKLCFFEQISDIMNGQCVQGRTTRIFSVGSYIKNDK